MLKVIFYDAEGWEDWSEHAKNKCDYFWIRDPRSYPCILMFEYNKDSQLRRFYGGEWVYPQDFERVNSASYRYSSM